MVNLGSVLRAWIILLGTVAGCVGLTSCAAGRHALAQPLQEPPEKRLSEARAVSQVDDSAEVFTLPPSPTTFTHQSRVITLTPDAPRDDGLGIQLVRVEANGTAVIRVDPTEGTFAAKPGEYFHVFGTRGLYLSRAEPGTQTAILVRSWAELQ
jgi:hypothetical protein